MPHGVCRKRSVVGPCNAVQHEGFAGRIKHWSLLSLFESTNLQGELGATIHETKELAVQTVDLSTDRRELRSAAAM